MTAASIMMKSSEKRRANYADQRIADQRALIKVC
jgi:hypothetical protein